MFLAALRDENGEYVINGPWSLNPSGIYNVAGTSLIYERGNENQVEYIQAIGPLNESLRVEVNNFVFCNFFYFLSFRKCIHIIFRFSSIIRILGLCINTLYQKQSLKIFLSLHHPLSIFQVCFKLINSYILLHYNMHVI